MPDNIDRREFARWMACGLAGTGAAGAEKVAIAAGDPPQKPPSLPVLVLARIIEEFPSERYDEAIVENILNDVRADLARGRELSAFPLKNADEPAFIFPADRRSRLAGPPREAP
jgi:hypothetical protein